MVNKKVSFGRGTKTASAVASSKPGMVYFNTTEKVIYLDGVTYGMTPTDIQALENAQVISAAYDAATHKITFTKKGGSTFDVALVMASESQDGLMSKDQVAILNRLNGADTVEGSLAKVKKDLTEAINGVQDNLDTAVEGLTEDINGVSGDLAQAKIDLASDIATAKAEAIKHTDDLVGTVEEGKTVVDMINAVSSEAKTYSVAAASEEELATLGTNVKEAYKLVDEDSVKQGEWIKVYKDSSISEIYLGSSEDTVDPTTGVVTKNVVAEGKNHQSLNYVYVDVNGAYSIVKVDVSKFLAESEFKNGLEVNESGEVSVKIDEASEAFLTVGADGVKLSGVQDAIDSAINALDGTLGDQEVDEGKHIAIEIKQVDGLLSEMIIVEDDIASAQGLADEIARAKAAEDKIEASVGLAADGSHVQTTGNYTSAATTITGEIAALDAQVKLNSDAIAAFTSGEGSVDTKISNAINALDSEVGGALTDDEKLAGKHLAVKVVQTDGKLSSLVVDEHDIASAKVVKDNTDAIDLLNGNAETVGSVAHAAATAEANANTYTDTALTWWEDEAVAS